MADNHSFLVLIAIVLGIEFVLKQLWESYVLRQHQKALRSYLAYRLAVFVLVPVSIFMLVGKTELSLFWWFFSLLVSLIATTELLVFFVERLMWNWFQIRCRWLNLAPSLVLSLLCAIWAARMVPWPHTEYAPKIALFILLAHPANYVIRWLLDKEHDQTLVDLVGQALVSEFGLSPYLSVPELAADSDLAERDELNANALSAGRTIGILERWIILLLTHFGHLTSIGFVVAVKSIVRFKKLEDSIFAEYYLLGTMYSVLLTLVVIAVLGGVL